MKNAIKNHIEQQAQIKSMEEFVAWFIQNLILKNNGFGKQYLLENKTEDLTELYKKLTSKRR